jgi:hypothetical protein
LLFCPEFRGFMLGIKNLKALVHESLQEQVNDLPRLTPSSHTLKITGYDAKAVVLDAILVFLLIIKVYPLVLKKVQRVTLPVFGLIIFGFILIYLTRHPVATANVQTVAQSSHLPVIQETIKTNAAPKFQWPVGGTMSQRFWWGHRGIDIPNAIGTPVRPLAKGRVVLAGWDGGYGYSVVVKHADGFTSRYAHLAVVLVKVNDEVSETTFVGTVGATGVVTGAHLHFELLWHEESVDPEQFLPEK